MQPTHSIIIPNLGREATLALCLESLRQSAEASSILATDWEVLVVGKTESGFSCNAAIPVRFIDAETSPPFLKLRQGEHPPFWKNHLLNVGIDAAYGEFLTFLDADAIVPPVFMAIPNELKPGSRLSYRVRHISYAEATAWPFQFLFAHYDSQERYRQVGEVYEWADTPCAKAEPHRCGNSQFTIYRARLGAVRWNEAYWGRGHEDLAMLRDLDDLPFGISATPDVGAMFHIKSDPGPGWTNDRWAERNRRRFYMERCLWVVCDHPASVQRFKRLIHEWLGHNNDVSIQFRTTDTWDIQEANQEYDAVLRFDSFEFSPTTPTEMESWVKALSDPK